MKLGRSAGFLIAVAIAVPLRPDIAFAHWCHDNWGSSYNIVVRPASDTVSVPASGPATLDVFVQNNLGEALKNFQLGATATNYTIGIARDAPTVAGFLMPGEKLRHTLTITRSGGGSLAVESIAFGVSFGDGGQSSLYGPSGSAVIIRKANGTIAPSSLLNLDQQGNDQAWHLRRAAKADYENTGAGLDDLLHEYCAGRGSWDHSNSNVVPGFCDTSAATTCPTGTAGGDGSKYDYQKLWAAQELASRKPGLGARAAVFRARLQCGWNDSVMTFKAMAGFLLGYLGDDPTSRSFLQNLVATGSANEQAVAKAALVLAGNAADVSAHHAAVVANLASSDFHVSAVSAAVLGIVDRNDDAVLQHLLPKADWIEPDTSDQGKALFAAHLVAVVAWDRRGWAANAADTGGVSFYEGVVADAPPRPPGNVRCVASAGGNVRVSWDAVTTDTDGGPKSVTQYKVYWGTQARPGGATQPGEQGFDYAHADTVSSGTVHDYTALDGTKTDYFTVTAIDTTSQASLYSAEVSCVPSYAPAAHLSCDHLSGTAPLTVTCNGSGSTDANGAGDIATTTFSLDGQAATTAPQPVYAFDTAGGHTVLLTVTDKGGLSSTDQATITVNAASGNQAPIAAAAATPPGGQAPLVVQLSSAGSHDPDSGQTITFLWDFRDGSTATQANPSHTFAAAGTYQVILTVTDSAIPPAQTVATTTVTVAGNHAPDVSFASASPLSGKPGLVVHFDASGVTDPEGNHIAVTWAFGDGTAGSTQLAVDHTYAALGSYTATLAAQDDGRPAVGPAERSFTIVVSDTAENRAPVCSAAKVTPLAGVSPLRVTLDASGCTDAERDALTYLWRIPTSVQTEDQIATATGSYQFQEDGTYTVRLRVTDNGTPAKETSREFNVVVGPDTGTGGTTSDLAGGCRIGRAGTAPGWLAGAALLALLGLARAGRRVSARRRKRCSVGRQASTRRSSPS